MFSTMKWSLGNPPHVYALCMCFSGCTFLYLLLNGMCKASCPEGYFEDLDQGVCVQCHESCATCSGPLSDDCESCSTQAPKLYEGTCSEECPVGTYYHTDRMECQGKYSLHFRLGKVIAHDQL